MEKISQKQIFEAGLERMVKKTFGGLSNHDLAYCRCGKRAWFWRDGMAYCFDCAKEYISKKVI